MSKKMLQDYTEEEFTDFVEKLCVDDFASEKELISALMKFKKITEHPSGSDLIFYPEDDQDNSPENIVSIIKEWRQANNKPGFKSDE